MEINEESEPGFIDEINLCCSSSYGNKSRKRSCGRARDLDAITSSSPSVGLRKAFQWFYISAPGFPARVVGACAAAPGFHTKGKGHRWVSALLGWI